MEEYADVMSQSFENELQKIAADKLQKEGKRWLLPMAAGAGLTALGIRAEKDRRLGRRVRLARQR